MTAPALPALRKAEYCALDVIHAYNRRGFTEEDGAAIIEADRLAVFERVREAAAKMARTWACKGECNCDAALLAEQGIRALNPEDVLR